MLPEIGATELMVIAAVALIVVGPKDLPVLLRKLGQFVARLRGMANEFRASFDEMARQSELDELRKEVAAMRAGQFTNPVQEAADAAKDASVDQVFNDIDASLKGSDMSFPPTSFATQNEPAAIEPEAPAKPKRKSAPKKPAAAPKAAATAPVKKAAAAPRKAPAKAAKAPAKAKS
ncbi:Sec-independent protein translocase protein TatB [Caulobacter sp. NIBR2454]|uniref:Sec-independent protein translocase protein TatB n=1 Tax=Caulobacter sp. NIBR2454 TaxID=3015996 RepID=UPI0022B6EB69|nr:Sec-independent protein translocase protein TatB [Caulobacter sp. NIBR2454]